MLLLLLLAIPVASVAMVVHLVRRARPQGSGDAHTAVYAQWESEYWESDTASPWLGDPAVATPATQWRTPRV